MIIKNIIAIAFSLTATVALSMSDPSAVKNMALQQGVNTVVITSGHKDDVTLVKLIAKESYRSQNIKSKIYLPETCTADNKRPAVIIDHSSAAPKWSHYTKLAKDLNAAGMIAVVTDHYSTRGITSTATGQDQLSYGTRALDVFSVIKYVSNLPCVDKDKIGMTGYSFGGNMTMMAVEQKYVKLMSNGTALKAALPVYPSCQRLQRNSVPTNTRVHMILGELDQATLASDCVNIMPYYKNRGWKISYEIFKGAHHEFIADKTPQMSNTIRYTECGNRWMENDGSITAEMFNINIKSDMSALVKAAKDSGCIRRGYMFGGTNENQEKLRNTTVKFFKENL